MAQLLFSLRLKAEALEARHFGSSLKLEDLTLAMQCLHSCDTLIDQIRFGSTDENDKLELGASANEVYDDGVRIAHAISEMTFEQRRYWELSFYFAEKSKSAVLQESIADAEAKSFSGIPADMLEKEKDLKSTIALYAQKLSQKPSMEEEKTLREKLFISNREYTAFIQNLEKEFPDYYNLKFNRVAPSIGELQRIVTPNAAIVSYFVSDNTQKLYSFILTKNRFRVYSSTLPEDFDKLVKGFNNSMYFMVADSYRESAVRLSSLLLRGIPKSAELIVIPAGRLGTIPFEALSTRKIKATETFTTFPFLILEHAISYEFSAGLILQKSRSKEIVSKKSIFLCAPIRFPEKDMLADLPGTELEVNSIASLFGPGS